MKAGANVDAHNAAMITPLHKAAIRGYVDVVEVNANGMYSHESL